MSTCVSSFWYRATRQHATSSSFHSRPIRRNNYLAHLPERLCDASRNQDLLLEPTRSEICSVCKHAFALSNIAPLGDMQHPYPFTPDPFAATAILHIFLKGFAMLARTQTCFWNRRAVKLAQCASMRQLFLVSRHSATCDILILSLPTHSPQQPS